MGEEGGRESQRGEAGGCWPCKAHPHSLHTPCGRALWGRHAGGEPPTRPSRRRATAAGCGGVWRGGSLAPPQGLLLPAARPHRVRDAGSIRRRSCRRRRRCRRRWDEPPTRKRGGKKSISRGGGRTAVRAPLPPALTFLSPTPTTFSIQQHQGGGDDWLREWACDFFLLFYAWWGRETAGEDGRGGAGAKQARCCKTPGWCSAALPQLHSCWTNRDVFWVRAA